MLQVHIGRLFATLGAIAFAFDVFLDSSPQAVFNAIETASMALVFLASSIFITAFFRWVQISILGMASFASSYFSETPFFGAAIAIFALVLIYAYGGYHSYRLYKIPPTIAAIFLLSLLSIAKLGFPTAEMMGKTVGWTAFIVVFCGGLWFVLEDVNRKFYTEKMAKILSDNKELLKINKTLLKGEGKDGTNK
jgi:hypothetical protein